MYPTTNSEKEESLLPNVKVNDVLYVCTYAHTYIKFYVRVSSYHRTNYKWSYNTVDPSILDTLGPERPVLIIKVSSFQGLRMYYGKV